MTMLLICPTRNNTVLSAMIHLPWSSSILRPQWHRRHMNHKDGCAFITTSTSSSSSSFVSKHQQRLHTPDTTTSTSSTSSKLLTIPQQMQRIRPPTQQKQMQRKRPTPKLPRTFNTRTKMMMIENDDDHPQQQQQQQQPDPNEEEKDTTSSVSFQQQQEQQIWSEQLFIDQTIQHCLQMATHRLRTHSVSDPYVSARALMAWTLQLDWTAGYRELDHDEFLQDCTLTEEGAHEYFGYLQRRLNHEPIQYILGQWDFLDYTLRIKPPLLCPRPETEELVELVLDDMDPNQQLIQPINPANIISEDDALSRKTKPSMRILDVGCGTGCIGIALADRILYSHVDAIDIEPVAIETSTLNANCILGEAKPRIDCLYLNKRLWSKQFKVANQYDREYENPQAEKERYHAILSSIQDYHPPHPYDLVVSNPPYIPEPDMSALDATVARHESYHALCGGGNDGMDVIRSLVRKLPEWCKPGAICWMECDPSHPALLQTWLETEGPQLRVRFVRMERDMFGLLRFVKLQVV